MSKIVIKVDDTYHKFSLPEGEDKITISIGRAFSNDIIIEDPFVGPVQIELRMDANNTHAWSARNVDRTNPVFLNRKIAENEEFELHSGDVITAGRTTLAFYSENYAVNETREFSFTNWLHTHRLKPLIAVASVLLLFLMSACYRYLNTWVEPQWGQITAGSLAVVSVVIIWSMVWSLIGYIIKKVPYFFSHLFFTSVCLIAYIAVGDIYNYLDYIFSSMMVGIVTDWITITLFWGLLIGLNLTLVTYNPRAFRNGMLVSTCVFAVVGASAYLFLSQHNNMPNHSVAIEPPYIPTTRPVSIEKYIQNYDSLFKAVGPAA